MLKPRVRRVDSRAKYPEHVVYAAYLYSLPAAFRMYLRGLGFEELTLWAEQYQSALPDAHQRALDDEYRYRFNRPQMRYGGKTDE